MRKNRIPKGRCPLLSPSWAQMPEGSQGSGRGKDSNGLSPYCVWSLPGALHTSSHSRFYSPLGGLNQLSSHVGSQLHPRKWPLETGPRSVPAQSCPWAFAPAVAPAWDSPKLSSWLFLLVISFSAQVPPSSRGRPDHPGYSDWDHPPHQHMSP